MQILWYSIIVATIIVFIVLHVIVLPRRFLRCRYRVQLADRGIQNINEEGGHSIIYAPAVPYRKFLKHYLLSEREGTLHLVCDFDKKVEYADFSVALYDGDGRVTKVLEVKQAVDKGETEPVALPAGTAYVSVKLNNVDGVLFNENRVEGVSAKNVLAFLGISSVIEILVLFAIKVCIARLYGGLFAESFIEGTQSNLITLLFALVTVAVNNLLTIITIKISNVRQTKRKTKNARV